MGRTRRLVLRVIGAWALLTGIGTVAVSCATDIDPAPMPSDEARAWAIDTLHAARVGDPRPEPPKSARRYEAPGAIVVDAWWDGRSVARHVSEGPASLVDAVDGAGEAFAAKGSLAEVAGWRAGRDETARVRFTLTLALGDGPLVTGLPYVSALGVVPLREGIVARLDGESVYLTPDEMIARGTYESGIGTPIPDLRIGVDVEAIVDRLARELGSDQDTLETRGSVARFVAGRITEATYPDPEPVTEQALRDAAVEGAQFLVRHQEPTGRYTYLYDGGTGRARRAFYNLPRHAGTTWFLALVDRHHGMPMAREGALSALRWLRTHAAKQCGGPDRLCIANNRARADVGSAALTVVAASELHLKEPDPLTRELIEKITAFLRAQQRPDGQLMHEWDLREDEPIDVQHMYYSGEAALALLKAHRALGDERNLETARRLMDHLTGAGWSFLGSRYYYGEEHWTCIAAGEAGDRIDTAQAVDFCRRWAAFNRQVQYGPGETPWASAGAYGVGPVLVPQLTPVGSRSEAFISTYEMARDAGIEDPALRAQIESGLGMLLRWRWAPGPTHLLAEPMQAWGALPQTPVHLAVRNDFLQHGGSAWIRWADVLARERERKAARSRDRDPEQRDEE